MLCSTHAECIFAKGRKLAAAYLPQEVAPNVILVRGTGVGPTGHRLGLSSTFDLTCHPAIFLHPRFMVRYSHRRHLQEDGEHRSDSPSVAGDAAWIRTNRAGPLRHHHRRGGRLERCRLEGLVRGGQPLVGFRGSSLCIGADPPRVSNGSRGRLSLVAGAACGAATSSSSSSSSAALSRPLIEVCRAPWGPMGPQPRGCACARAAVAALAERAHVARTERTRRQQRQPPRAAVQPPRSPQLWDLLSRT